MLRVFGKSRRSSIMANKAFKYILYALGEVVLVTIGILIALNINNRNAEIQNEQRFTNIFLTIQEELIEDVYRAEQLIAYYEKKDSIAELVLLDQVTVEDYQNPQKFDLYGLVMSSQRFDVHDNAYQNLMAISENIPTRFKHLVSPLSDLHVYEKPILLDLTNELAEMTNDFIKELSNTKPWFSLFSRELGTNQEIVNYFHSDPFYKNEVARFSILRTQNVLPMLRNYRRVCLQNLYQIAEALGNESVIPEDLRSKYVLLSDDEIQKMVGVYAYESGMVMDIFTEESELVLQIKGQPEVRVQALSDSVIVNESLDLKIIFKELKENRYSKFEINQAGFVGEFERQ